MSNFFIFDEYESLSMKYSEFSTSLKTLSSTLPPLSSSTVLNLQTLFQSLQDQSDRFFNNLINAHLYESNKSAHLSKKLLKSKTRAIKYLTLQREMNHKQLKIKSKNRSLTSSLNKLQKIWKGEVRDLESSLQKQKRNHSKLSTEYQHSLNVIEKEITRALDLPIPGDLERSMNTSREFDELMQNLSLGQEFGMDNSRISMEKNMGGWASEYDSDKESRGTDNEDVKQAIKILMKANLIGEENSLHKLGELLGENQGAENLELLIQLIDIQSKNKVSLMMENTTPMTSLVISDNDISQTLISPGHRGPLFFGSSDFEQEYFGIN